MTPQPLRWLTLVGLLAFSLHAAVAGTPPRETGGHTIRFTETPVQADAEEVKWRLHAVENPGPFDITREEFQIFIPKEYRPDEPWGLFLWIGASDNPRIPADWEAALGRHKLLFVGALRSGNTRNIFDRVRMAVCASTGMRTRYRIDEQRVYVSGFSGGARVASMVGVAFADLFSGAMPFMGVNFYTPLPAPDGKEFGISYIPDDTVLAMAKKRSRFVLFTGEKDFNRVNTRAAEVEGFRKEGFTRVLCLEVPGLAHAMPTAERLEKGLEFLDAR